MSQFTYDDFLRRGLESNELWDVIKTKCVTHHDMLLEMRERQIQLATYAKMGVSSRRGKDSVDAVQRALLGDIKFLETMAWRVYMFGSRNLFTVKPGTMGELQKKKRTDPGFWAKLSMCKMAYGPPGCNYPENAASQGKSPCSTPKCNHKGARHAEKWLKKKMRAEWEATHLRKYNY